MAALLCAKDLCKTYVIDKRQNNVLKNINLEVKEGRWLQSWDHPDPENPRFCMPSRDGSGNERSGAF